MADAPVLFDKEAVPAGDAEFMDFLDPEKGNAERIRFDFLAKCVLEMTRADEDNQDYSWPKDAKAAYKRLSKLADDNNDRAVVLIEEELGKAVERIKACQKRFDEDRPPVDRDFLIRSIAEGGAEKLREAASNWLPADRQPTKDELENNPLGVAERIWAVKAPESRRTKYMDVIMRRKPREEVAGFEMHGDHPKDVIRLGTEIGELLTAHPQMLEYFCDDHQEAARRLIDAKKALNRETVLK